MNGKALRSSAKDHCHCRAAHFIEKWKQDTAGPTADAVIKVVNEVMGSNRFF